MLVTCEKSIENFDAWSGAINTQNRIIEAGKVDEFDSMIEELYPDGIDETQLNDLLWFESDWIYETWGISEEDEEDEEDEEEEEEE